MSFLCDSIYFITVFLFGSAASVCFTGVPFNRKNILSLSVFCALDGILQIISFAVFGQEISRGLYPVVVHLPLVLFLWLIYKCSWITSIVSVLTAYMCCQIPLWCGLAVRLFSDNKIIYTIVYVGCAFVTFYFLYHYEANLTQHFMPKANKSVYILGILPLCYYLFDYASTIYTDMLYTSNEFVVQFMPSICCIFYFVFIFYYYHKLEEQEQAERLAESLHMQLTHAAIDLNHMRTMQTQAASYRHDMRHHFTYLQALAGTGNLDKIQEYIQTVQSDLDAITPKRFCSNELINLLLSAYDTKSGIRGYLPAGSGFYPCGASFVRHKAMCDSVKCSGKCAPCIDRNRGKIHTGSARRTESDASDPDQQSVYRNGCFSKWAACLHADRTWFRN